MLQLNTWYKTDLPYVRIFFAVNKDQYIGAEIKIDDLTIWCNDFWDDDDCTSLKPYKPSKALIDLLPQLKRGAISNIFQYSNFLKY